MSNLLMNEVPLMVQPSLAAKIGLNEALFLQQVHYWISRSDKVIDNKRWIYNSIDEWHKQFPFWSCATIKRTISNLEKKKLIISANYNRMSLDRTKWYSIDYEAVERLENKDEDSENISDLSIGSNCTNGKNQGFSAIETNKAEYSEMYSISEPTISSNCTNAMDQNEPTIGSFCTDATDQFDPTNNQKQQQRLLTENTTTTLSENLPSDDGVVVDKKLLKKQLTMTAAKCGIRAGNMKIFFGKYKLEDISRQLILLEKNMKKGTISNPAGWLRSALEHGYIDSQAESALLAKEQKQAAIKKAQEQNRLQLEALKKQQELDAQTMPQGENDDVSGTVSSHAGKVKIKYFGKDLSIAEQDDIDIAQKRREVKRRTVNDNRT